MDPPTHMSGAGKAIAVVMMEGKTVTAGNNRVSAQMRHKDDPSRCGFNAFTTELFRQQHLDPHGQLHMEDFIPVMQDNGNYHHPWYDRRFFYGNTKATKGQACHSATNKPFSYKNANSLFHAAYERVEPPIISWHVLHLQRGTGARKAEQAGAESFHIGSHGGWRHRGASVQSLSHSRAFQVCVMVAGYQFTPDSHTGQRCLEVRQHQAENPEFWKDVQKHDNTLEKFLQLLEGRTIAQNGRARPEDEEAEEGSRIFVDWGTGHVLSQANPKDLEAPSLCGRLHRRREGIILEEMDDMGPPVEDADTELAEDLMAAEGEVDWVEENKRDKTDTRAVQQTSPWRLHKATPETLSSRPEGSRNLAKRRNSRLGRGCGVHGRSTSDH
ncbi:hypothetical protein SEMRO_1990_G309710.1 [Seminavis robusta]|uniref:Uncharacterized protein n=1 Tax=Seminavis robusta TaxID=568900 RepID=A0A9N8EXJ9_9STRA|nr:hypothetical protein SEMRO_1990_G309710.1 [Seminavis robusta]|eukprot:Sro1990_g309710.1 n/a (384) ;mRNA; r:6114-7441